jgi:GT2 family glycosyltransferase
MTMQRPISAIIATLGRPELLSHCLESLTNQTVRIAEVVVVHCGDDSGTEAVTKDPRWAEAGLDVRYFHHQEKNCAQQRNFAVARAKHNNLLFIDDDVEVDPHWAEELFHPIWADPRVGATMGKVINQPLAQPTLFWRLYRIVLHGRVKGFEPGRLVGAALPNGFPTTADKPIPCEWIGGGDSALRREAFESVGGFASFFTGSSPGEDLDLGYRLSRNWKVYYVPSREMHSSSVAERTRRVETTSVSFHAIAIRDSDDYDGEESLLRARSHRALGSGPFLSEVASLRHGLLRPDLPRAWSVVCRDFCHA